LPIPDRQHLGLITHDAKDPDTAFRPLSSLVPGSQVFVGTQGPVPLDDWTRW